MGGIYVAQGAMTLPGTAAASNTTGTTNAMTSGESEPAQNGGGGGGLWGWLGSLLVSEPEAPPLEPGEAEVTQEDLSDLLDDLHAAGQQVTVGTMPGRRGETIEQRFANTYQTIAVDFPIYMGGQALDVGVGILIGSFGEFVAFQVAAKARGFVVRLVKTGGGKLVLKVSSNLKNASGKFKDFIELWNAEYTRNVSRGFEGLSKAELGELGEQAAAHFSSGPNTANCRLGLPRTPGSMVFGLNTHPMVRCLT